MIVGGLEAEGLDALADRVKAEAVFPVDPVVVPAKRARRMRRRDTASPAVVVSMTKSKSLRRRRTNEMIGARSGPGSTIRSRLPFTVRSTGYQRNSLMRWLNL